MHNLQPSPDRELGWLGAELCSRYSIHPTLALGAVYKLPDGELKEIWFECGEDMGLKVVDKGED